MIDFVNNIIKEFRALVSPNLASPWEDQIGFLLVSIVCSENQLINDPPNST